MAKKDSEIDILVPKLAEILISKNLKLSTAESCTGGGIACVLTETAGSSAWYDSSIVSYSNHSKVKLLGISEKTLEKYGAVSQQVAESMVSAILQLSGVDVALSVTGIAGPSGGTEEKPVGTVWISWKLADEKPLSQCFQFSGTRSEVRSLTVQKALMGLQRLLTYGNINT